MKTFLSQQQMTTANPSGTSSVISGMTHRDCSFRTGLVTLVVTAGQIMLLILAGCTTPMPKGAKITQLPELHPPLPIEKKLARATLPAKAVAAKTITLSVEYQWSEPNPISLEVWHSTGPVSKPGGPTWSILLSATNGAPWNYSVKLPATNDMEWFQVRGRDPHTGVTGGWATVAQ